METIADDVMVGELEAEPLEGLQRVLEDVYIPLLSNSANQEGWGEQAAKDLMAKVHDFLASVSITIGQTKGETCLPLPPFDQGSTAPGANKDRVHQLESSVVTWTKQIKNVLKQVSAGGEGEDGSEGGRQRGQERRRKIKKARKSQNSPPPPKGPRGSAQAGQKPKAGRRDRVLDVEGGQPELDRGPDLRRAHPQGAQDARDEPEHILPTFCQALQGGDPSSP